MTSFGDEDLADWATHLPSWLQEALWRLPKSGNLEEWDYVELM